MRKWMKWMMAATLICGVSIMTSCSKDDEVIVVNPDKTIVLNCEKPDYLKAGDKVALMTPQVAYMETLGLDTLDTTVRLSIGLEAGENLLEDIKQAVK